jgi:hypothetical protein
MELTIEIIEGVWVWVLETATQTLKNEETISQEIYSFFCATSLQRVINNVDSL